MRRTSTGLFWNKKVNDYADVVKIFLTQLQRLKGKYYNSDYFYPRCFFGSDWPVCRMASGIVDYPETLKLLEDTLKDKPVDVKKAIFQDNVIEFYNLHEVVQL